MSKLTVPSHRHRFGCPLGAARGDAIRRQLRLICCSEPWVDAQFLEQPDPDDCRVMVTRQLMGVFPPGGPGRTAMKWCRRCGRYTPPQCVSLIERRRRRRGQVISATLHCDDCRIDIDEQAHRELHQAGLHLQPPGSQSFVTLKSLRDRMKHPNR